MNKYRIIEKDGYFYPQRKNGLETLWCWAALYRDAYLQYKNVSKYDGVVISFFKSFEEAKDFIDEYKKKKEIKYYYL